MPLSKKSTTSLLSLQNFVKINISWVGFVTKMSVWSDKNRGFLRTVNFWVCALFIIHPPIFYFPVGRLPRNNGFHDFVGARALPSLSGNGAYLQHNKHFYELVCSTSACTWSIMEKQLKNPVSYATLMYLPHDYTC